MMDPTIGRWLEEDPDGFAAGDADLYRYVGNDPTNLIDPSGLSSDLPTTSSSADRKWVRLYRPDGLNGLLIADTQASLNGETGIYIRFDSGQVAGQEDADKVIFYQFVHSTLQVHGRDPEYFREKENWTDSHGNLYVAEFDSEIGTDSYISTAWSVQGGNISTTSPPDKPDYILDHIPRETAYYNAPGTSGATKEKSWIFDSPTSPEWLLKRLGRNFNSNIMSADMISYFDTFMEYKGKVVARVSWQVSAVWTRGVLWDPVSPLTYKITYVGTDLGENADKLHTQLQRQVAYLVSVQASQVRLDMPTLSPSKKKDANLPR